MPAPQQNTNGRKHGLRSERALSLSQPPAGSGFIKREASYLRRRLEAAVKAAHGSVSITAEFAINAICRAEIRSLLAAKWLRDAKDLSPSDKLNMVNAVAEATAARDAALAKLRLDAQPSTAAPSDPWAQLDAMRRNQQAAGWTGARQADSEAVTVETTRQNGQQLTTESDYD